MNFMKLAQFAKYSIGQDGTGCGIVYAHTRADTETLAQELCKRGVVTKVYHAGLEVEGSYLLNLSIQTYSRNLREVRCRKSL